MRADDQFQPQLPLARGCAVVEVARRDRAAALDLLEHPLAEHRLDARPPLELAIGVVVHPEPHHRPQLDRHERLDVRPVLDHPPRPALRRAPEQVHVVGAHPGVERHEVRALEHVDRVDLQHPRARERALERAHGRRLVPLVGEPLRGERDPAGLREAERLHDGHPRSPRRHPPPETPVSRAWHVCQTSCVEASAHFAVEARIVRHLAGRAKRRFGRTARLRHARAIRARRASRGRRT